MDPIARPPLRFVLPRAPATFVGRSQEVKRVTRIVEATGLVVITGPAGIGKTALARASVRDACVIRCERDDPFEQLAATVLTALGATSRASDPQELAALMLDLVERRRANVVIEDLHELSPRDQASWLELLRAYTRDARWFVTTRTRPTDLELLDHVVDLLSLSDRDAYSLARACSGNMSEETLDAIVARANGVPLTIRELTAVALREPLEPLSGFSFTRLSAAERAYVASLAEGGPLSPRPELEPLHDALLAAGVLVPSGSRRHLHDLTAQRIRDALSADELSAAKRAAASRLCDDPNPIHLSVAFKLLLELGDVEAARALAAEAMDGWIEESLSGRVWNTAARLLADVPAHKQRGNGEALALDLASRLATRASLSWLLTRPPPESPSPRRRWAAGALRAGAVRRAVAVAASLPDVHGQLLHAHALNAAGEQERSVQTLESLREEVAAGPLAEKALWAIRMAAALLYSDRSEAAREYLRVAERDVARLRANGPARKARADVGPSVESLATEIVALRVQIGLEAGTGHESTGARAAIFRGLRMAVDGQLNRSSEVLASLRRRLDLPASADVMSRIAEGIDFVTRGRYGGLRSAAQTLLMDAESLENARIYHLAFLFERLVNLAHATTTPEPTWSASIAEPSGVFGRYLASLRACHAARRGDPNARALLPTVTRGDGPLVVSACELADAFVHLVQDEPERAVFLTTRVVARGHRMRLVVGGEALTLQCVARLHLHLFGELRESIEALEEEAARVRSPRFEMLARLFRCGLRPSMPLDELLVIARGADTSPGAARVAVSLLGGPEPVDAYEAVIVESLRSRWDDQVEAEGRADWLIDVPRQRVVVPSGDGSRIASVSPLAARLLEFLGQRARAEEDADAEPPRSARLAEIAEVVWKVRDYHPLRDAKRIHVAVRRLRKTIEEDAATPTRLVTTPGGYALASRPGFVVPSSSSIRPR